MDTKEIFVEAKLSKWDETNIAQMGLHKMPMSKAMYAGRCPFCRTGDFVVWLDKGRVHCYGCGLDGKIKR